MTVGLILAAGGGTRYGAAPKLLAQLDGRPVLSHVAEHTTAALDRVVVVLGAHAERILAEADLHGAEHVVCADWASGQAASLRAGLEAVGDADKVLVLLGDTPLVTPTVIARMAREPAGARAAYRGVPGHPTVLGRGQLARARRLDGDAGLRDEPWRLVEVGHLASNLDIDTPDDLEAVRREARAVL